MMDSLYRPFLFERTLSSPQMHRVAPITVPPQSPTKTNRNGGGILTPPVSPVYARHARSSVDLTSVQDSENLDVFSGSAKLQPTQTSASRPVTPIRTSLPADTEDGIRTCAFEVELLKDQRHEKQIFGRGAWSTVYKGTCHPTKSSPGNLLTPPPSPPTNLPLLVAVKTPGDSEASAIVRSEAKILTQLMLEDDAEDYVVTFHGILLSSSSIVMTAVPLSLEDFICKSAQRARDERTTENMRQPVIGSERLWLDLAYKSVSALSWLHNTAGVIHGDIKPGNILLSPRSDIVYSEMALPLNPLFCDFSSSQIVHAEPSSNTLSAVTREYTAPELLSSKALSNPLSMATTASDVFSMAVTLLVAATGNTGVYPGTAFQRLAMARQGWEVIGHVRSSDAGVRVPRQGLVERAIDQAVLREGMGRITAEQWTQKIENLLQPEPSRRPLELM